MNGALTRNSVSERRKWSVEDILSESDLPKIFKDIEAGCEEIALFKGKLTVENAIDCLLTRSKIGYKIEKAYVYLNLKSDENKADSYYLELCEKIEFLLGLKNIFYQRGKKHYFRIRKVSLEISELFFLCLTMLMPISGK